MWCEGRTVHERTRSTAHLPDGLAVRIPGSHPGGPGSTPGQGARIFPHVNNFSTSCTNGDYLTLMSMYFHCIYLDQFALTCRNVPG